MSSDTIGWIVWWINAYLAYNFASGVRNWSKAGKRVTEAGVVQSFLFLLIAIVFLVTSWNKINIIWLIPVVIVGGNFIALGGIPIVSPLIMFCATFYKSLLVGGLREELDKKSRELFIAVKKRAIPQLGRELSDAELEFILLSIPGYQSLDLYQISQVLPRAVDKYLGEEKQSAT